MTNFLFSGKRRWADIQRLLIDIWELPHILIWNPLILRLYNQFLYSPTKQDYIYIFIVYTQSTSVVQERGKNQQEAQNSFLCCTYFTITQMKNNQLKPKKNHFSWTQLGQWSCITISWYFWFWDFGHLALHLPTDFLQFHNPPLHSLQMCFEFLIIIWNWWNIKFSSIQHNLFIGLVFLSLFHGITEATRRIGEWTCAWSTVKHVVELGLLRNESMNSSIWRKFCVQTKVFTSFSWKLLII